MKEIIFLSKMLLKLALLLCLISLTLALQPRAHDYRPSNISYDAYAKNMKDLHQSLGSGLYVSIVFLIILVLFLLSYFLFWPKLFQRNPKQFSSQSQGQPA